MPKRGSVAATSTREAPELAWARWAAEAVNAPPAITTAATAARTSVGNVWRTIDPLSSKRLFSPIICYLLGAMNGHYCPHESHRQSVAQFADAWLNATPRLAGRGSQRRHRILELVCGLFPLELPVDQAEAIVGSGGIGAG